jgi:hypothetical protein
MVLSHPYPAIAERLCVLAKSTCLIECVTTASALADAT